VGPLLGFGLFSIWLAQALYRLLQMLVFVAVWKQGRWALIKV
jgi:hypothetical protein